MENVKFIQQIEKVSANKNPKSAHTLQFTTVELLTEYEVKLYVPIRMRSSSKKRGVQPSEHPPFSPSPLDPPLIITYSRSTDRQLEAI